MRADRHKPTTRRGVTLLEMLVTVALLLLMMSTIVAVFQAATGAVTVSRAFTVLDQEHRRLDATLRGDLAGVTCRMTPPNNPADNLGYFEYAENALSDAQDEDSDDTLRFTAKAPPGRPFTGRKWVPTSDPSTGVVTRVPIPVTSDTAEIIYFQRGNKLYRRVLLIGERVVGIGNTPMDPPIPGSPAARTGPSRFGFRTALFEPLPLFRNTRMHLAGGANRNFAFVGNEPFVSWQGMNDISARPSAYPPNTAPASVTAASYTPTPNTLGDLTDRHNRAFSPRFSDDFRSLPSGTPPPGGFRPNDLLDIPDGVPDDFNVRLNGPRQGRIIGDGVPDFHPNLYFNSKAGGLLNDSFTPAQSTPANSRLRPLSRDRSGFPWVFPNAYTGGIQVRFGLLHAPDPGSPGRRTFNHNPLPTGDSLATPTAPGSPHTWWGFPTWRETMAPTWFDPVRRINDPVGSPSLGDPISNAIGEAQYQQTRGLSPGQTNAGNAFYLPPQPDQPFTDGVPTLAENDIFNLGGAPVFEDDLIATNVRSFNVKAFDANPGYLDATGTYQNLLPGYFDLGYVSGINPATGAYDQNYASGRALAPTVSGTSPLLLGTLGHEGRMPPLVDDNRVDPQHPTFTSADGTTTFNSVIGDDTQSVVRLRRVWDSWSRTYTNAPALPLDPTAQSFGNNVQPYPLGGPLTGARAVVPSYPPPYPAPLRGIEIQIRLFDPTERHAKSLTIRQDFADKL